VGLKPHVPEDGNAQEVKELIEGMFADVHAKALRIRSG
jgi:hypothetical protein